MTDFNSIKKRLTKIKRVLVIPVYHGKDKRKLLWIK